MPKSEARKPAWLNETEAQVWDQYAPQLLELGLLTGMDVETFSAFCRLAAKIRTQTTVNPNDVAQLRLIAACFGMTPSDRPRLSAPEQQEPAKRANTLR
jgi:phage terminase small subunit